MHTIDFSTSPLFPSDYICLDLEALHKKNTPVIKISERSLTDEKGKIRGVYFLLEVDCLALMQKQNIELADIPAILAALNSFLAPAGVDMNDFSVCRIDFCKNVVMSDELKRNALFDCLNMMPRNLFHLHKTETFKHGLYLHNKSRVMQVYDKNVERDEKWKGVAFFEWNVVRLEVQVKTGAIKRTKCSRDFSTWVNLGVEEFQIRRYLDKLPHADFRSLPEAEKHIDASSFSSTMKARLTAFIQKVADTDMDTAMSFQSRDTNKKYIRMLAEINVNPVTINPVWSLDFLEMPFK